MVARALAIWRFRSCSRGRLPSTPSPEAARPRSLDPWPREDAGGRAMGSHGARSAAVRFARRYQLKCGNVASGDRPASLAAFSARVVLNWPSASSRLAP